MLSRALGYFQNTAEFGNDWALSAVRRATQVGIIGGDMVLQANEGLSRDDVAQMTFNTLTRRCPCSTTSCWTCTTTRTRASPTP